jgi:hypothetical protein
MPHNLPKQKELIIQLLGHPPFSDAITSGTDHLTVLIFLASRKQAGGGEAKLRTAGTYLSTPDKLK